MTAVESPGLSPWARTYLRTSLGVFALAFTFGFQTLAAATIMPDVARDLGGLRWYALAFSVPLAASVPAFALAGWWTDRRGTRSPVDWGCLIYLTGCVLSGATSSMPLFLLGRATQGLGSGLLLVTLYVVLVDAYPEDVRTRAFGMLTAAWAVPALIGPALAGAIAVSLGWRWVFFLVAVVALLSWGAMRRATVRRTAPTGQDAPRMILALLAAAALLGVSLAGSGSVPAWPVVLILSLVGLVATVPRLLPPGTWLARPGLPSAIATRGLISASFLTAEVYVPLLLVEHRGLSASQGGIFLTVGALAWVAGTTVLGRVPALASPSAQVRLGILLLVAGTVGFAISCWDLPLAVAVVCWAFAGLGIGLSFLATTMLTMAAAPGDQIGRVSSALQTDDAILQALAVALGGTVFALLAGSGTAAGAVGGIVLAAAVGLAALGVVGRLPHVAR